MCLYFVYCKIFHLYNPQHSSQCNYKTSSMESKDLVESLYASLHCGLKNRKKSEWKVTIDSCKKINSKKRKKIIFWLKIQRAKTRVQPLWIAITFFYFSSSCCWLIYHCLHSRKWWPLWIRTTLLVKLAKVGKG